MWQQNKKKKKSKQIEKHERRRLRAKMTQRRSMAIEETGSRGGGEVGRKGVEGCCKSAQRFCIHISSCSCLIKYTFISKNVRGGFSFIQLSTLRTQIMAL